MIDSKKPGAVQTAPGAFSALCALYVIQNEDGEVQRKSCCNGANIMREKAVKVILREKISKTS